MGPECQPRSARFGNSRVELSERARKMRVDSRVRARVVKFPHSKTLLNKGNRVPLF